MYCQLLCTTHLHLPVQHTDLYSSLTCTAHCSVRLQLTDLYVKVDGLYSSLACTADWPVQFMKKWQRAPRNNLKAMTHSGKNCKMLLNCFFWWRALKTVVLSRKNIESATAEALLVLNSGQQELSKLQMAQVSNQSWHALITHQVPKFTEVSWIHIYFLNFFMNIVKNKSINKYDTMMGGLVGGAWSLLLVIPQFWK